MELKKISEIAHSWQSVTWEVIEFKKPTPSKINQLFNETYELLAEYSTKDDVPKGISKVLLEMNEFCWWVSDLDETPLHKHYQELYTLACELNKSFFTRDAHPALIEDIIRAMLTW